MQITARRQRLHPSHLKYVVAALGITVALAAGVVTYNVTRDDAETQQPVHALPAIQPVAGDEGTLSSARSATIPREANRPALREGVVTESSDSSLMTGSRKGTGIPSVIDRAEIHAIYVPGAGEGAIAGNETADLTDVRDTVQSHYVAGAGEGLVAGNGDADLSYLAPEVRPYEEALFLEWNWADGIAPATGSSNAGMLDEELTQQNPGANT